jgi:hypothetical protein
VARSKPLACYSAIESALRERLAPAELHHQGGHDPSTGQHISIARMAAPCGTRGDRNHGIAAAVSGWRGRGMTAINAA